MAAPAGGAEGGLGEGAGHLDGGRLLPRVPGGLRGDGQRVMLAAAHGARVGHAPEHEKGERLLCGGASPTLRRPVDGRGERVGELAARVRERASARALGIAGPTVGLRVAAEGEVALRELEEIIIHATRAPR